MMYGFATIQFDNIDHPWVWLVLLVGGVWALFAIYRGIFQRSERRQAWWLMLLRAAGLLALALALAKPTRTSRTERIDPGRLAIVLDNSVSMSLADVSGKSRYTLAKEAVIHIRKGIEADRSGPKVVIDLFDINGTPLPDGPPAEPSVARTDLARAISETASRLRSQPMAGIVLVSDGMDNTGQHDILAIEDTPAPVYTIGFREDTGARELDLAVRQVKAPNRVIVNNTVKVDILVEMTGGPATEATVTIRRGSEQLASQKVSMDQSKTEQMVSLNFTPTQAGRFVYIASVAPGRGERLLANNVQPFSLQVDEKPIRVFYIEGFLRYEYKYLKNRLEDDPDISLVSVVRRVNPEHDPKGSEGELITTNRLENFDVVILGDMRGNFLTQSEYQALISWIDAGHSLLVLGGYQSFGPKGFRVTALSDVLPVVFADKEPFQSEYPFVIELTEEGRRHPVFEISGDRVKDAALWGRAPHLLGASLIKDVKPGADVLAVNPNFNSEGKPVPVVAVQRYGEGHTMVLTVDTTWRWSRLTRVLGQSDTLFARFWSQTIRWLSGRDPDRDRAPILVSTDRPDYEIGKPVTVRVVCQPQSDTNIGSTEVTVEVVSEDGKIVSLPVKANSMEPDVFTGTFYPSAGGRCEVTAALTADSKLIANQLVEFLVHGSGLELADTRINRNQLQSISAGTGGVYYDVEKSAELVDKIQRKERRTMELCRVEFWNSPWLFMFFLAAITVEWLIRRKNHLI